MRFPCHGAVLTCGASVSIVLRGPGQRRPDFGPRAGAAHRAPPISGGAVRGGAGRAAAVQGRRARLLQERREALRDLREELPQPAPPAAGGPSRRGTSPSACRARLRGSRVHVLPDAGRLCWFTDGQIA